MVFPILVSEVVLEAVTVLTSCNKREWWCVFVLFRSFVLLLRIYSLPPLLSTWKQFVCSREERDRRIQGHSLIEP